MLELSELAFRIGRMHVDPPHIAASHPGIGWLFGTKERETELTRVDSGIDRNAGYSMGNIPSSRRSPSLLF